MKTESLALEQHFSVSSLAKLWGCGGDTIRRLFRDEPGVVKLGHRDRRNKRQYVTLLIPASVASRVHENLHGKVAA